MTKAHPQYTPGDRIITPSERTGTVQPSPWTMPCHSLIEFDDTGKRHWILTEILKPLPTDWKPTKKAKNRRTSAA
jgi:hypothetical protein